MMTKRFVALVFLASLAASSAAAQNDFQDYENDPDFQAPGSQDGEANCSDRRDDDGDGMVDCADADCYDKPECAAGGSSESTLEQCSDWIDNDGDGLIDCDDDNCKQPGITHCYGSSARMSGGGGDDMSSGGELPELADGMTVDDLIGVGSDNDGERNDYLCSDGIDNDADGAVDCADYGCRFDPSVTVCQNRPSMNFSVVAMAGLTLDMSDMDDVQPDVGFTRIQVRALGSIPMIDNSFFLLSMRMERTPRLTFLTFQVPIADSAHYFSINSGGGNLSSGPIVSIHKLPLLERPFYLFNAFEQGNGAAVEFGGPLTEDNRFRYRAFLAGGTGVFNGNVGGRFFAEDGENFTWAGGAQVHANFIGFYDRFDSFYLYVPVPTTLALLAGGKYEERARERFPAANGQLIFRDGYFIAKAESYVRHVIDFEATQISWNFLAGVLIIPKHFFIAADIGSFYSQNLSELPEGGFDATLRRPDDILQWRAAAHWYFFRNIGVLSAVYGETYNEVRDDAREFQLQAQFRF